MKGVKCGLLLAFFIIFGLSLSVFSNANATTYSTNLDYVQTFSTPNWTKRVKLDNTDWTTTNRTGILPMGDNFTTYNRYVGSMTTDNSFDIVKDHIYQVKVQVFTPTDTINPINMVNEVQRSSTFSVIDVSVDVSDENERPYSQTCFYGASAVSGDVSLSPYIYECKSFLYSSQSKLYTFLLKARSDGHFPIKVGNDTAYTFTFEHKPNANGNEAIYVVPYTDVVEYKYSDFGKSVDEMNQKDNEDRDNLQTQSSQTDSDAESSASDAESTGTTLLGAFTSFVNALTNASPSNCNLDMDLGNLDLGVVNLCQLSLPQPLPTIASIMLILFCVPLSISTARKVISLFRSFQ